MNKILNGIKNDLLSIPGRVRGAVQGIEPKKLFLSGAPYLTFGYVSDKISWQYRHEDRGNFFQNLLYTLNDLGRSFHNPLPSLHPADLLAGICGGTVFFLVVYCKRKNAKKFRHGTEYGSASWGTAKDIQPYIDPVFENNVILTATERLMMSGRPKQPKYARNKNVLVIGGSGSGKTRFFVKPNLMQMNGSYCVTDPNR